MVVEMLTLFQSLLYKIYEDANLALNKIEGSHMFDNRCVSIVDQL